MPRKPICNGWDHSRCPLQEAGVRRRAPPAPKRAPGTPEPLYHPLHRTAVTLDQVEGIHEDLQSEVLERFLYLWRARIRVEQRPGLAGARKRAVARISPCRRKVGADQLDITSSACGFRPVGHPAPLDVTAESWHGSIRTPGYSSMLQTICKLSPHTKLLGLPTR